MLRKIISLSISLIIIVTGLILTNLSLPFYQITWAMIYTAMA